VLQAVGHEVDRVSYEPPALSELFRAAVRRAHDEPQ
jgi:hypothetical protein